MNLNNVQVRTKEIGINVLVHYAQGRLADFKGSIFFVKTRIICGQQVVGHAVVIKSMED